MRGELVGLWQEIVLLWVMMILISAWGGGVGFLMGSALVLAWGVVRWPRWGE